jgi:hypothetical protein
MDKEVLGYKAFNALVNSTNNEIGQVLQKSNLPPGVLFLILDRYMLQIKNGELRGEIEFLKTKTEGDVEVGTAEDS